MADIINLENFRKEEEEQEQEEEFFDEREVSAEEHLITLLGRKMLSKDQLAFLLTRYIFEAIEEEFPEMDAEANPNCIYDILAIQMSILSLVFRTTGESFPMQAANDKIYKIEEDDNPQALLKQFLHPL